MERERETEGISPLRFCSERIAPFLSPNFVSFLFFGLQEGNTKENIYYLT